MSQEKAVLPEGTWAINKEDKKEIQKLGRELHKFLIQYAKTNAVNGKFFPWKIMSGAFDYFQQLQGQKVRLVGDDILAVQDLLERYNMGELLEEPFQHIEIPTGDKKATVEENNSPSPTPEVTEEATTDPVLTPADGTTIPVAEPVAEEVIPEAPIGTMDPAENQG